MPILPSLSLWPRSANFAGSLSNLALQVGLQKSYCLPLYVLCAITFLPEVHLAPDLGQMCSACVAGFFVPACSAAGFANAAIYRDRYGNR